MQYMPRQSAHNRVFSRSRNSPQSSLCSGGLGSVLRSCHGSSGTPSGRRRLRLLLLVLVALSYSLVGAAVFTALERRAAIDRELRAEEILRQFLDKFNCVDVASVVDLLKGMSGHLTDLNSVGPNGTVALSPRWGFSSSLYFSMTVITTVGFGNLAPVTNLGRSFCCLYALMGIPLLALLLAGMADLLKYLAQRILELDCWRGRLGVAKVTLCCLYVVVGTTFYFVVPALAFTVLEGWSFPIGIYVCMITLSTIGFGDYIPGQKIDSVPYKVLLGLWTLTGIVYMSGMLTGLQLMLQEGADSLGNKLTAHRASSKLDEEDSVGTYATAVESTRTGDCAMSETAAPKSTEEADKAWGSEAAGGAANAVVAACRQIRVKSTTQA